MYVFIDESGTHKSIDHSTFALVYIAVQDYQAFERQVLELEKELRISAFHWAETGWELKRKFMERALAFDFQVKIAIVRNPVQVDHALQRAMEHMIIERNIKQIFIDGKKSKRYERLIKKILRDKGVPVKRLKTVHDTQYSGIRVADMVAGLSRAYADQKNAEKIAPYFERLRKKIIITLEQ